MIQVKGYNKIKAARYPEMQNCWELYIGHGFIVTTQLPKTFATLKTKMKQI
jgi:hypothetical protein